MDGTPWGRALRELIFGDPGPAPSSEPAQPAPKAKTRQEVLDEWKIEFEANRTKAIAELPPEPPFKIWQSRGDGWWRVGRRHVITIPRYFDEYGTSWITFDRPPPKESEREGYTRCVAFGSHDAFAPTFLTQADAEAWLRDYVNPPPEKSQTYDDKGRPV